MDKIMRMGFRTGKKYGSRSRGQALAEFVMIIGVLLLLVFGVVDLGRIISQSTRISSLTREAARIYILNDYTPTQAPDAVYNDNIKPVFNQIESNLPHLVIFTILQRKDNPGGPATPTNKSDDKIQVIARHSYSAGTQEPEWSSKLKAVNQYLDATHVVNTDMLQVAETTVAVEIYTKYTSLTPLSGLMASTGYKSLYDVAYY